jgi:hypothetical protein
MAARQALRDDLPGEPHDGVTPDVGLTQGFAIADGRAPGRKPLPGSWQSKQQYSP